MYYTVLEYEPVQAHYTPTYTGTVLLLGFELLAVGVRGIRASYLPTHTQPHTLKSIQ